MTVCATAKRRRKQMAKGNRQIAKLGRPIYRALARSKAHRSLEIALVKQMTRGSRTPSKT